MFMENEKQPLLMIKEEAERESGHRVQLDNIEAANAIADVVRTCLGPRAMLKMLIDTMGGTVITNDGNAILREVAVKHPAANSMIEISRAIDQEAGDGTTSVIILAGEVLSIMESFLKEDVHPVVLIKSIRWALDDLVEYCNTKLSKTIDVNNEDELMPVVSSCLQTKVGTSWIDMTMRLAVDSVRTILVERSDGYKEIDIKRLVRIEKIPGNSVQDSKLINGVVLNKDVLHATMKRRIENPRVIVVDVAVEFHKLQSDAAYSSLTPDGISAMLAMEEKIVKEMTDAIVQQKPDLVFCEKGVSDLAQHYFSLAGVTVLRRIKSADSNRISKVCGATVVSDLEDLTEDCVGTKASLFNIEKIGDEYFAFLYGKEAKACTLLLRGPSRDIIDELERNLQDALCVVRNLFLNPKVLPGGGAAEMSIAQHLKEKSDQIVTEHQFAYRAVSASFEVIPRTLIQNSGADVMRQMALLRAKHSEPGNETIGINGETGELVDMNKFMVWDPLTVRSQVYKTALEASVLLLRIDDIISGVGKGKGRDDVEADN